MANINGIDTKKNVTTFIHACIDKGLTVDKGFDLLNELMILIEEKRCTEEIWFEKIEKAVAEANNKVGAVL